MPSRRRGCRRRTLRGRGGANVLFCDGHVQWFPQTDLLNVHDGAAGIQMARAWMVNYPY